jgi:hypothetical protein
MFSILYHNSFPNRLFDRFWKLLRDSFEELNYLFGDTDYHQYPEADQLTQLRFMKLWIDFVKCQFVIFDWKCWLYLMVMFQEPSSGTF